jgi:rhamnose utilization protein RhaD (predicted bifunctional aldolase and dehydrogenase)
MPGFALAKLAASIFEKDHRVEGLVLLKHGIFTFGDSAEESYERMIRWVDRAERQLAKKRQVAWRSQWKERSPSRQELAATANIIRGQVTMPRAIGRQADPLMRMIVRHRTSPAILRFVNSREGAELSQIGPATPDHVIRTKPKPLVLPPMSFGNEQALRRALGARLEKFKKAYQSYVA